MLTELHNEIVTHLAAQMPGVFVDILRPADLRLERTPQLPACLVEMTGIEPHPETFGNPRAISHVSLNFEARLLVDVTRPQGWVEIKDLAVVTWWALRAFAPQTEGVGPLYLKHAGDDSFTPYLEGYLLWVVEWEIEVWIGAIEAETLPILRRITALDNHQNTLEVS